MRVVQLELLCLLVGYIAFAAALDEGSVGEQKGTSSYQRQPAISTLLPYDHAHLQTSNNFVEQVHLTATGTHHVAINWVTPRNPNGTSLPRSFQRGVAPHEDVPDDCTPAKVQSLVQVFTTTAGNKELLTQTVKGSYTCYSTSAYDSGLLHLAIVGPLEPGTFYKFKCGDPTWGWSESYSFRNLPTVGPSSLPFRLGIVGDVGQTHHSRSTLQHLQDSQPGLVLDLGDLSYADGDQTRWDSYGRLIEPFFASMLHMTIQGNHEVESYTKQEAPARKVLFEDVMSFHSNSPMPYDKHFLAYETRFYLPATEARSDSRLYYSFNVAGAHIIMLGCYTDFSKKSRQYKWLQDDLANLDRQNTPWLLVGMHAPWYNSNTAHQQEMAVMRHSMEHLLHKHRADIVFSGHVHSYERTCRVYKEKHHHCAPYHIVIGDGGNREGLSRDWEFPQPHWSSFRESSYGHGTLDLFNSTHALWRWVRNHDHSPEPADHKWIVRDVDACLGSRGLERDWAKEQEEAELQQGN